MRLFASPEFFILMLLAMVGVGYFMMLISKKKPRKKPRNPYRRGNERNDQP